MANRTSKHSLKKADFVSDQEVRWCPGCGDYAILNAVQQVFPTLGLPREKFVVVSGIGCSSRFPYYMNTYGFHGIHGRAPAIASGLKITRPDLSVWVVTGDGDALSIGGNHLIHAMRRNVGLKILMFNNRIYGLTKGQYSPTSEQGKRTKSSPFGSLDRPFNPISLALGAECTFVARSVDIYQAHLKEILTRAAHHEGTAFVEILQNCNIFNDHAFSYMTDKPTRDDNQIVLRQGKPLVFGKSVRHGIRMNKYLPEVVDLSDSIDESELVIHDKGRPAAYAFLLSRMLPPEFPTPIGIFRDVDQVPFEQQVNAQIQEVTQSQGPGQLRYLLNAGETWEVS
ncbi:MAG: 2-oxoacid:ferredoxin oxidoreductase subunit beta [Acidobacteriota bacterium]